MASRALRWSFIVFTAAWWAACQRPAPALEDVTAFRASQRGALANRVGVGVVRPLHATPVVTTFDDAQPAVRTARQGWPGLALKYESGTSDLRFGRASRTAGGASAQYAAQSGVATLVLTRGARGLKEDLVLFRPLADSLRLEWRLETDPGLEARLEPSGAIGVYGEPGVMRYELPAPVLHDAHGTETRDGLKYELHGDRLALVATGLGRWAYPVDLDPTVVVTLSSEFARDGNFESGVSGDNNALTRAVPASGLGTWSSGPVVSSRAGHAVVAANGNLYALGGTTATTALNDVQYSVVDSATKIPGAWVTTTPFSTPRSEHVAVSANGYLYVMGGKNQAGTLLADVQFARIAPNGTVGAWATTTPLPTVRSNSTALVAHGYVYVMGGTNSTVLLNDTVYAPINPDGTLGPWVSTTTFATARSNHASALVNDCVYVAGGSGGASDLSTVQVAHLTATGALTTWAGTTDLPSARRAFTLTATNGALFMVGGVVGGAESSEVHMAVTHADCSLGPWSVLSVSPLNRANHAAAALNGYVYVVGGAQGPSVLGDTSFAATIPNGSLTTRWGSWAAAPSFTTGRWGHATVAVNGYLYILAGVNSASALLNDVQFAPILPNGTLGAWAATTSLPFGRQLLTAVAHDGYLYVLGGNSSNSSVMYAKLNADGTLGAWASTTSLVPGRFAHASTVANGRLYVYGGSTPASVLLNDVQFAPFNPDGTLGAWVTTTSFANPRFYLSGATYNGYFYVVGGGLAMYSNFLDDVQYAAINADGTLGNFALTTAMPAQRAYHGTLAYNGSLYVAGGYRGGFLSEAYAAPFNNDGTIGAWSPVTALPTTRAYVVLAPYQGFVYETGGYAGTTYADAYGVALQGGPLAVGTYSRLYDFGTDVSVDSISLSGNAANRGVVALSYRVSANDGGAFGPVVTAATDATVNSTVPLVGATGRYLSVQVTLDDTRAASVTASGNSQRDLTDLAVAYRFQLGTTCTTATDCVSGYCVDGVCCDTACAGGCDVCNASATRGTCTVVAVGSAGVPSCAPYVCSGAATCPAGCTSDAQCVSGDYCSGASCVPKLNGGASCGADTECSSAHCVDGVCCDTSCAGACDACNVPATVGTCTNVAPGSAGAPSCAPYVCTGAPACATSCSTNAQCANGYTCSSGVCVVQLGTGAACAAPGQCASGHCVDGVCCDTACGGPCDACDVAGSVGTCAFSPAGSVGTPSCAPFACTGNQAVCPTSCLVDGDCTTGQYCAQGLCQGKQGNGTSCTANYECTSGQCVDGVCCNSACAGACDACDVAGAVGTCTARAAGSPGVPSCAPFVCTGNTAPDCPTTCAGDEGCAVGQYCLGAACVPKQVNGRACTSSTACSSGHCVDGFCCDSACDATCDSCNVVGSEGTCSVTPVGSAGNPSCAPYVCGGKATGCTTSCDDDSQCASPSVCTHHECLPGAVRYNVACGCNAAGPADVATLLLALAVSTRRRRRY